MIDSIIFDWGGVLIKNPANDLLDYCSKHLGASSKLLAAQLKLFEQDFQKGNIPETLLWDKVCKNLNVETPKVGSLWRDAVEHVFKDDKGMFLLIEKLRSAGYKIGILSNTELPTVEYFREKGYEKYFDATIFSCIEKSVKPEPKIFNIALEKMHTTPEKTIFIDDKPLYVDAASSLGINGIVFKNSEDLVKKMLSLRVHLD